jgi:hypothetical protein
MKITIEINSCRECPFFEITGTYSTDGFDSGDDWYCKKASKSIATFVEWNENPEIPKWCPEREENK